MKIKVAICTLDEKYCEKLVNYFNVHYYDKFQWNVYTQPQYLEKLFSEEDADILLVGEELEDQLSSINQMSLSKKHWAFLTSDLFNSELNSHHILKYRRADEIYRNLLDFYAEKEVVRVTNDSIVNSSTSFIAVVSPAGGAGASTLACAAAKGAAGLSKVLYLNLASLGGDVIAFNGEQKSGMDEIVYAIKSRRNTLELKLESSVSRDSSGVYFFQECQNPMDMYSLTDKDIKALFDAISASKVYSKVIVDIGSTIDAKSLMALSMVNRIVMVMDQTEIQKQKFKKYVSFMQTHEQIEKVDIVSKIQVYFNRTYRNEQIPDRIENVRVNGAMPLIENGDFVGVIQKLSQLEVLQTIK